MNEASIRKILAEAENQPVMVETKVEIFIGLLVRFDGDLLMELSRVYDLKKHYCFKAPLKLRLHELRTVRILKSSTALELAADDGTSLYLDWNEIQCFREQLDNIVCIAKRDIVYHEAVKDLQTESVIGVLVTPFVGGFERKPTFILTCTRKTVYFFDMMAIGKVSDDLKQVLVQQTPQKVMHCSNSVHYKLKHWYDIEIDGVLDTYLPSQGFSFPEKLSLEAFIVEIFNLPMSFFRGEDRNRQQIYSYIRPLSNPRRLLLAQTVMLLYKSFQRIHWGYCALSPLQQNNESLYMKAVDDHMNAQRKAGQHRSDTEGDDGNEKRGMTVDW